MTHRRFIHNTLIVLILSSLILPLLSTISFAAQDTIISINDKQDIFIYDEANLIDDTVEKELNQLLINLEEKTEAEFAIISIPSLNNMNLEDYSVKLFNNLGIGKKGKDNGVLLLFSKTDNKVRLEIGRGLEGCLNDAKCGRILDNYFVPHREQDKYTEAAYFTANAIISVIAEEYGVEINGVQEVDIPDEDDDSIPLWIIIILIALVILIFIADQRSGGASNLGLYGRAPGGFSSRNGFGGGKTGGGGASR